MERETAEIDAGEAGDRFGDDEFDAELVLVSVSSRLAVFTASPIAVTVTVLP